MHRSPLVCILPFQILYKIAHIVPTGLIIPSHAHQLDDQRHEGGARAGRIGMGDLPLEFRIVDDDHRFDGGAVPAVAWIAGDGKNLVHMPHIGYKVRIGGRCVLLPCQISAFCIHDRCRQ